MLCLMGLRHCGITLNSRKTFLPFKVYIAMKKGASLKGSFYVPVRRTTWKKTSPDFASVRRPTWVQSHNITNMGWGQSYTDIVCTKTLVEGFIPNKRTQNQLLGASPNTHFLLIFPFLLLLGFWEEISKKCTIGQQKLKFYLHSTSLSSAPISNCFTLSTFTVWYTASVYCSVVRPVIFYWFFQK